MNQYFFLIVFFLIVCFLLMRATSAKIPIGKNNNSDSTWKMPAGAYPVDLCQSHASLPLLPQRARDRQLSRPVVYQGIPIDTNGENTQGAHDEIIRATIVNVRGEREPVEYQRMPVPTDGRRRNGAEQQQLPASSPQFSKRNKCVACVCCVFACIGSGIVELAEGFACVASVI